MISIESLIEKLPQLELNLKNFGDHTNSYYMLNTISSKGTPQDHTLYVGESSSVSAAYFENERIGLILLSEDKNEFDENIKCELAFYDGGQSILEIFHDIQKVFQEENRNVSDMSILIDGIIRGKSTTELIDMASNLLDNAIMLTNSSYKVIAMSKNGELDDPVWLDAKKYGCCSADSIAFFKRDKASKKLFNGTKSFIYNSGLGLKIPRILRKITMDNQTLGYICVFESNTKLESRHIELTDKLCDLLAIQMKNDLSTEEFTNVIYENLISDLLGGKMIPEISLNQRIAAANWELKPHFCVLKIEVKREGNSCYYCDYVKKQLGEHIQLAKTIAYYDDIILVLNFSEMQDYETSMKKIVTILKENEMKAGASRIFEHLTLINAYHLQACSALELGFMFEPDNDLFYYEDYSIYHLFSMIDREDLKRICHPHFYKLEKYDLENTTDYTNTLYQYILCGSNISEAASRLFIHRNTLFYRLKKINQIIDIDFKNGEDIFQFYLAKKIDTWFKIKT